MDATPIMEACQCWLCTEPIVTHNEHGEMVVNNLHGELRPCEDCGRAKSEYTDHGTHGKYHCWWCNERAAEGVMVR